jgi:hypothetical protein
MCLLSLMSDASCMPLQGIYGADIVQSYISLETVTPEAQDDEIIDFYPHCVSPLFNYQAGALSPYGDELLSFLQALCTKKGLLIWSPPICIQAGSCAYYYFGSGLDDAEVVDAASTHFHKSYKGKSLEGVKEKISSPTKECADDMRLGVDYVSADHLCKGLFRVPAVVARFELILAYDMGLTVFSNHYCFALQCVDILVAM